MKKKGREIQSKRKERNKERSIKEKTSNGRETIRTTNKIELMKESGQEYKNKRNRGRRKQRDREE
jgi:hypothetical protein